VSQSNTPSVREVARAANSGAALSEAARSTLGRPDDQKYTMKECSRKRNNRQRWYGVQTLFCRWGDEITKGGEEESDSKMILVTSRTELAFNVKIGYKSPFLWSL